MREEESSLTKDKSPGLHSSRSDPPILANIAALEIFQGDLDTTGEIFDAAVELFTSGSVEKYDKEFTPHNSGWGSHIRILAAAALSTQGDILECGTGFFSTPVLNNIVRESKVRLQMNKEKCAP